MNEIINKILCDIKELKKSLLKKIIVFFEGEVIATDVKSINFEGDVEVTHIDNNVTVKVVIPETSESGNPIEVSKEGTVFEEDLTRLNFIGDEVTVSSINGVTDVTISSNTCKPTLVTTTSATYTWNACLYNTLHITLEQLNNTVNITNFQEGQVYTCYIKQNNVGGNTITFSSTIPVVTFNNLNTGPDEITIASVIILSNSISVFFTENVTAPVIPYKVYTAILNQSGTNAPTATVLENTLVNSVVISRSLPGVYVFQCDDFNFFIENKTFVLAIAPNNTMSFAKIIPNNPTAFRIQTYNYTDFINPVDDALSNSMLEIRVYN